MNKMTSERPMGAPVDEDIDDGPEITGPMVSNFQPIRIDPRDKNSPIIGIRRTFGCAVDVIDLGLELYMQVVMGAERSPDMIDITSINVTPIHKTDKKIADIFNQHMNKLKVSFEQAPVAFKLFPGNVIAYERSLPGTSISQTVDSSTNQVRIISDFFPRIAVSVWHSELSERGRKFFNDVHLTHKHLRPKQP